MRPQKKIPFFNMQYFYCPYTINNYYIEYVDCVKIVA